MRSLFNSVLGYFLTPVGLVLMGALDSSLVFFLPLGIDFVVIILSARNPELFWLYALLATSGSVAGAGVTFWLGRKVGEHGLSRLVKPSTLKRVEAKVSHSGAVTVAALGIIPPPFPFTAFVLTSGALRLNAWRFLSTLAGVRLVRFGIEAGLAAYYGRRILTWMDSTVFEVLVGIITGAAILGTIVSAVAIYRSIKREKRERHRVARAR
jgi:membrane protein YqaA with SNARE-associated domain